MTLKIMKFDRNMFISLIRLMYISSKSNHLSQGSANLYVNSNMLDNGTVSQFVMENIIKHVKYHIKLLQVIYIVCVGVCVCTLYGFFSDGMYYV